MSLSPGTRVGNHEILSLIGSGGMGEVYRARDVRLGRDVAIKALPEAFARDPERLARFEREARLLASVPHPNIAMVLGLEDSGGTACLVIELVEGESLAQRLARGALPLAQALDVCAQVAAAVDAAHAQGVVHRDLKPGNVMLTPAGIAKVLDFGLAKIAVGDRRVSAQLTTSPTVVMGVTSAGMLLGTAAYMSPEQARGQEVDRRTDLWSLGCLLYECLSGRQAFSGETTSDIIARILEREPDWSALPSSVTPRLRDVLRRCLTKAVADRLRDAGELRGQLLGIATELSSAIRPPRASTTPSVAVLYFENLSADTESDYFCAGITEDILTDLSKLRGLRVASRNAVARYRGSAVDIPRVAGELGVGAVLEGSVRRAGDRVRITAQLLQADGFHLWADRYDRRLDDVFAVQDEIAASITGALKVALSPAETSRLGSDRPANVQAYDLYLKGREMYGQYRPEALAEAMRLFEAALDVDQDYALAWAGVADVCGQLLGWGLAPDPKATVARGLQAARRAIALDPKLPDGHKAEALVLRVSGDFAGATAAHRRAIEADPNFTPALSNMAVQAFGRGNMAGAERLVRRVLEIDPVDLFCRTWLEYLLAATGRWDEADRCLARHLELAATPFHVTAAYLTQALMALLRDRDRELPGLLEAARAAQADPANLAMIEALLAARSGQAAKARGLLHNHGTSKPLTTAALALGARAAHLVGNMEFAVELLRRPVVSDLSATFVRLDHGLHFLLDHPAHGPRVSPATLVWPLEAPMIDAARHRLFREVRIESALPEGSDVLKGL